MAEELVAKEKNTDQNLMKEAELTPEVKELANEIDYHDAESVANFGSKAQQQLDTISKSAIDQIKTRDTGVIGDQLKELTVTLEDNSVTQDLHPNIFQRLFSRGKKSFLEVQASYQSVGANIDEIANFLTDQADSLIADNKTLTQLYEDNVAYNRSLSEYITAGKYKLDEMDKKVLPKIKSEEDPNDPLSAQRYQNALAFRDRLAKRVNDLELVKQVSIQQAPQIAMMRSANAVLADKINQTVNTAIPLWRNQTTMYMMTMRQQQGVKAQKAATDVTNKLMEQNSEILKISTQQVAKESSRSIIDIKTLKKTQKDLVDSITGTLQIEQENANKRQQTDQELKQMNDDMLKQLAEARSGRRIITDAEVSDKDPLEIEERDKKSSDSDFM